MANKSFKTHCSILDYIEKKDPDLHSIIRGLCASGVFTSFKGKPGITFLWPQDPSFLKKLKADAESDNVGAVEKARERLYAHVIRDVFKSPAEWMSKKDDIPNSLFPSQRVELESTSAKEVVFKSGAKATIDPDFIDSSQKKNIAVWKLTGELPVTTDKPSAGKYLKAKGKTGGYDPNIEIMQTQRFQIGLAVENEYALLKLSKSARDPFCEAVFSLLYHILHVRKDLGLLYDKVLPLISFDKPDFYILVEPHRLSGNFILDNELINDWWNTRLSTVFSAQQVVAQIQQLMTNTKYPAKIYSARREVLNKIMAVRREVLSSAEQRPRDVINCMDKFYVELDEKNTIGGFGPVYPPGLAAYYQENAGLKMIHDELRYVLPSRFGNLEKRAFNHQAFAKLTNDIGDLLCHESAVADKSRHQLLNRAALKYAIMPVEKVDEIKIFVFSTVFMFMPITSAECDTMKAKYVLSRPSPNQHILWNIQQSIYKGHSRIISAAEPSNVDIINLLRQLNTQTIGPELRQEIIEKFSS